MIGVEQHRVIPCQCFHIEHLRRGEVIEIDGLAPRFSISRGQKSADL